MKRLLAIKGIKKKLLVILTIYIATRFIFSLILILTLITIGNFYSPPIELECTSDKKGATGYLVYKGNTQVGMLLGSFHSQINYEEQDRFTQFFTKEAKKDQRTVFTEIPQQNIGVGGVDACVVYATYTDNTIKKQHLESFLLQKTCFQRSIILGTKIIHLPFSYAFMQKHTKLSFFLTSMITKHTLYFNRLYDIVTRNAHSRYIQSRQQQSVSALTLYQDYMSGQSVDRFTPEERYIFCMANRDKAYAQTLDKHEGNWLAIIGNLHLSGKKNVAERLQEKGYTVKEINTYQMAMQEEN